MKPIDGEEPAPVHNEEVAPELAFERKLTERFRCSKCKNTTATVTRIAATGTGFSRLFNFECNRFLAVSCRRCSFTELFNLDILEGPASGMNILDLLFGG